MVTDQKHSSDSIASEQEVIRHTKKLAKLLGLDEQMLWNHLQNKVNSVLSSDDYLKGTVNELLAIGECNCSKKYINTSFEPSSSELSNSDIDEIVNMIKQQRIWKRLAQRKDQEKNAYNKIRLISYPINASPER